MSWNIHLLKDGQDVRVPAKTMSEAISVACIFTRAGLEVIKVESASAAASVEVHFIRSLCVSGVELGTASQSGAKPGVVSGGATRS